MKILIKILLLLNFFIATKEYELKIYEQCVHKDLNVFIRWYPVTMYHMPDDYEIKGFINNNLVLHKKDSTMSYFYHECINYIKDHFYGAFIFSLSNQECKKRTIKLEFLKKDGIAKDFNIDLSSTGDCQTSSDKNTKKDDINYDNLINPDLRIQLLPFKSEPDGHVFFIHTMNDVQVEIFSSEAQQLSSEKLNLERKYELKVENHIVTVLPNQLDSTKSNFFKIIMKKPTILYKSEDRVNKKSFLTITDYRTISTTFDTVVTYISHHSQIEKYNLGNINVKIYPLYNMVAQQVTISHSQDSYTKSYPVEDDLVTFELSQYCKQDLMLKIQYQYFQQSYYIMQKLKPSCESSKNQYVDDLISIDSLTKEKNKWTVTVKIDKSALIKKFKIVSIRDSDPAFYLWNMNKFISDDCYLQYESTTYENKVISMESDQDYKTLKIHAAIEGDLYIEGIKSYSVADLISKRD